MKKGFYWYDSHKNNSFKDNTHGYDLGEWISVELAEQLSDKRLDTRSVGKISFTEKGGDDTEDRKECYAFMDRIVRCLNKDKPTTLQGRR